VGALEGNLDGLLVGNLVGSLEGALEGSSEGACVGTELGICVGSRVGACVGIGMYQVIRQKPCPVFASAMNVRLEPALNDAPPFP
jgi:hypothetical protein